MYFFYNQEKKEKNTLFNKTNPLIVRINTRQLKGERRGEKTTRYKNNFPWFDLQAISYNLRNSFSPELFWVRRKKMRQNVPVELYCSLVR